MADSVRREPASAARTRRSWLGRARRAPTPRSGGELLAKTLGGRWLVLGKTALQNGPRQNADEPAVFDHRHAFEILLLQRAKRFVEVHRRVESEERRLGDLFQLR